MTLLLALDAARRTGYAFGPAGERPEAGSWELRLPREPVEYEGPELLRRITALTKARRPEIILIEDWLRMQGRTTQSVTEAQLLAHGAVNAWAGFNRIKLVRVAAATYRKHVCGKASAGDRDSTKRMVRDRVVQLGLAPAGCADLDMTDALALWRFGEDVHADVRGSFALVAS